VAGVREAFQPGTEPRLPEALPVDQTLLPGVPTYIPQAPAAPPGPVSRPAQSLAPPPRQADDIKGLF
jgi:hypothetical protein